MRAELSQPFLHMLNITFFVVHSALILFNLIGWKFSQTRRLHLACVAATLFSWIVMGWFRGFGYCLCTDWHFQIRRELKLPVVGHTYLQLLTEVWLGISITRLTSDLLTAGGLLIVLVITLYVWIRPLRPSPRPPES